jgi:hypothetical protein
LSYVVSYAIMGAGLSETMNVSNEPDAFEEVEHTADWALRVRGRDLRELLVNAARGMSCLLVPDLDAVPTDVERACGMAERAGLLGRSRDARLS